MGTRQPGQDEMPLARIGCSALCPGLDEYPTPRKQPSRGSMPLAFMQEDSPVFKVKSDITDSFRFRGLRKIEFINKIISI